MKVPASVLELQEASQNAFMQVEARLGETETFEAWVDVTSDLEEVFLEEAKGLLGTKLIELVELSDDAFELRSTEAEALIKQTAHAASRVYPIIHRLRTLAFGTTREEVVRKLETGEVLKTVKINDVSVTPVRRTVIGLLRDLDRRIGTNLWSLEYPPELPSVVVPTDPFNPHSTHDYWRDYLLAKRQVSPDQTHTLLTGSEDKTQAIAYELGNIIEQSSDTSLQEAARTILAWLDRKAVYYQNPDPRDFEFYHLGLEEPQDLMTLFRSLDTIKHTDPELFLELLGINPEDGGRSPYFGSFLHKAVYNTQQVVDRAAPELGELALRTMLKQLLTLDERVKTYAGVISQEALKAMAGEIRKSLDTATTPAAKSQALLMMSVPYTHAAVDAEVRRQLDALRETSIEAVQAELVRHLDDIEHPRKTAAYIGQLTPAMLERPEVRKLLEPTFGKLLEDKRGFLGMCRREEPEVMLPLYDRIPYIDETRDDLGFGLSIRVRLRDMGTKQRWYKLYRPNGVQFDFNEKPPFSPSAHVRNTYSGIGYFVTNRTERIILRQFNDSCPEISDLGAASWIQTATTDSERVYRAAQLIAAFPENRFVLYLMMASEKPDLVFLTLLGHPTYPDVASQTFSAFCDMVPAERMLEILNLKAAPVKKFRRALMRERDKLPEYLQPYAKYLQEQREREITEVEHGWIGGPSPEDIKKRDTLIATERINNYRKINRLLIEKSGPLTVSLMSNVRIDDHKPTTFKVDIYDLAMSVTTRLRLEHIVDRRLTERTQKRVLAMQRDMTLVLQDRMQKYHDGQITLDTLEENIIGALFPNERWDTESRAVLRKELTKRLGTQNRP